MELYGPFRREAMERGIPADQVDRFAEQLRFAIWVGGGDGGEDVVGQSGGLPRLPVDAEWPSERGIPLPFVASLDCAALPKVERLPLPVDENLMFASDTVQQLVRELTYTDELIELVQDLWPTENGLASLRIGGYTKRIGGSYSPEEQMARASLRARLATGPDLARPERIRWRREEESRLIREWVPLAQFPTEFFVTSVAS